MAMITAQTVSAQVVSSTQMMISGAMATTGVTCISTAYGNRLISIHLLCTNSKDAATPSTTAMRKARKVTLRVM